MYHDHYGLTGRPFQLTPDPAFFFESITHRKALSYLGYGLAQGEGFIVITGEVGAGKSTLVAHLMATIDRERLTAGQIVTSALGGDDLIAMAARAFGLAPVPGKAAALAAIETFLHAEAREGRRALLVVDEAQNLSEAALEELRMLSNFQLGPQALLQIFLLGQPEFRETVRSPALTQLRQRIIATHHLEGMQPEEIGHYIAHRLKRVGWTGRPDFSDDALATLHAASDGIPRRLNQLLERTLLLGALERADTIDAALVAAAQEDMAADGAGVARAGVLAGREPVASFAMPLSETAPMPDSGAAADRMADPADAVALAALRADLAGATDRVAALEARCETLETELRRAIAMLIEWVDNAPDDRSRAA